jgi:integrase
MTAEPGRLEEARRALAQVQALLGELPQRPVPTVADYLPRVQAAAGPARRSYASYWNQMARAWGDRRIDEILATDVEALRRHAAATAVPRRNGRDGRHAGEHAISAARAFFNRAIADGYLTRDTSPAHQIGKPRRLPSTRRALTRGELAAINTAATSTGHDPALDALLLRLHTETACRRGGALALRIKDVDTQRGLILLREKGQTQRWQPISLELATHLLHHAHTRGGRHADDPVLRYHGGRPLTGRRYDQLWARIGRRLPWVAAQGITTHWLRHTTVTWVERNFGYATARAYAGHTDKTGPATTTYIKADLREVATALATLTGQPHPSRNPAPSIESSQPGAVHAGRETGGQRRSAARIPDRGGPGHRRATGSPPRLPADPGIRTGRPRPRRHPRHLQALTPGQLFAFRRAATGGAGPRPGQANGACLP